MKIIYNDKGDYVAIILENFKENAAMVNIVEAAMSGKPLNKRSNAHKMAQVIDDDMPIC